MVVNCQLNKTNFFLNINSLKTKVMIVLIGKPFNNYRTSNDIYNYLTNDKVKRFGVLNIDRYINETDE